MKKFVRNLQNNCGFFALTLLVGVAFSCVCVVSPSLSGELISAFTANSPDAMALLGAFLASSLCQALLSQADDWFGGKLRLRLKCSLRSRAFRGFFRQGQPGREAASTFSSFVNNDISTLAEQYFTGVIDIVKILSLLALSAASLLRIHWLLALVILAVSLLLVAVPRVMRSRDGAARRAYSQAMAQYNTLLGSLLGGMGVARAYGYQRRAGELLEEKNQAVARSESVLVWRGLLIYGASAWLQIAKTMLIFLAGLWLIGRGELDAGGLVAVVQLAALTSAPLEALAYLFHSRSEAKPLLAAYEAYACPPEENPGAVCGPFQRLALEHVSLQAGQMELLRDVSAEFLAGKKYLITGESGSGKSTLLGLLSGSGRGWSGRLSYNGVELSLLDRDSLSLALCPVFHEPYLFYATLEENILLGRDISREEVRRVIDALNLGHLMERCQGQVMTPELLEKLSGGERQRVALARAMVGGPQLYLLDEVTSALDRENARLVEELLLSQEAGVIHVCHKTDPALAGQYDGELRMSKGTLTWVR